MPQMAPMLWLILYIYFVVIFVYFIVMTYYLYFPSVCISSHLKANSNSTLSWLW
nr:ATP synthase F0 subunit 8 [Nigrobaetis niger]